MASSAPPRALVIAGATATGKTAVGEAVAARLGGEIVCADSRQVFRELEAGTGKPDARERAAVPHHLFDALALEDRPSAGWYARAAAAAIRGIVARGRTPILVGGSGLYVRALVDGLAAEPPHDAARRARLQAECAREGIEALHRRLAEVDPATAARLAPRDTQRITRALEVWEASGRPISWWQTHTTRPELDCDWRIVEIALAPSTLAERIAARTHAMFGDGLVAETRALVDAGRRGALERLRAIGYDEALAWIDGRADRAGAEEATNARTRRLAKRQRTWFRHQIAAERLDGTVDPAALADAAIRCLER